MVRPILKVTAVTALVLAWFAGAWCFCAPPAAAAAAVACRPAGTCPLCPTPARGDDRRPAAGWCPVLQPAMPDRAATAVERPVLAAVLPAVSAASSTSAIAPAAVRGPQGRPPPRSLFDLHCSLLG